MKPSACRRWTLYSVAVIILIEACLQIFYRVTTGSYLFFRNKPPIFAFDPVSGWTNMPLLSYRHVTPEFVAEIYTNSQGFRVSNVREEYTHERDSDVYRILLLGPSFAFGWGVNYEDTFGAQLQKALTNTGVGGKRIEILNHGVPYQSPSNGLAWFNYSGKDFGPNLVIQFVYGSLEVTSSLDNSITASDDGHIMLKTVGIRKQLWGYAKNSATVFYSGVMTGLMLKALHPGESSEGIEGAGREMRNSAPFEIDTPGVKESLDFYNNLKQNVEESGAHLLIVYFPLAYVVHPEDRGRWALHGVENVDRHIDFNRMFASYLNESGIRCLNLTDSFIDMAKKENGRLYYWLDIHWTKQGNAVAAKSVGRFLTDDSPSLLELGLKFNQQVPPATPVPAR